MYNNIEPPENRSLAQWMQECAFAALLNYPNCAILRVCVYRN